jgi:hypothetical protein
MLSALDHKSSMGRLFGCICPCSQHWITGPLWVACSHCICPCSQHWITSPLWVACSVVSVHALSTGSQVLYGSLVLIHRFRLFARSLSSFVVSRHTNLTSLGLDWLSSCLRFCLSLSRLLSYSCMFFLLITLSLGLASIWAKNSTWPDI